jgi:hypothetical protein
VSAGEYPGQLSDYSLAAPVVEAIEALLAGKHRRQRRGAIEAAQVPIGLTALEGKNDPAMRSGNMAIVLWRGLNVRFQW